MKELVEPLIVKTKAQSEFHGPVFFGSHLWLGGLVADPTTTGWGAAQAGILWYNRTTNLLKYWNGTAIKTVATV